MRLPNDKTIHHHYYYSYLLLTRGGVTRCDEMRAFVVEEGVGSRKAATP